MTPLGFWKHPHPRTPADTPGSHARARIPPEPPATSGLIRPCRGPSGGGRGHRARLQTRTLSLRGTGGLGAWVGRQVLPHTPRQPPDPSLASVGREGLGVDCAWPQAGRAAAGQPGSGAPSRRSSPPHALKASGPCPARPYLPFRSTPFLPGLSPSSRPGLPSGVTGACNQGPQRSPVSPATPGRAWRPPLCTLHPGRAEPRCQGPVGGRGACWRQLRASPGPPQPGLRGGGGAGPCAGPGTPPARPPLCAWAAPGTVLPSPLPWFVWALPGLRGTAWAGEGARTLRGLSPRPGSGPGCRGRPS